MSATLALDLRHLMIDNYLIAEAMLRVLVTLCGELHEDFRHSTTCHPVARRSTVRHTRIGTLR